MLGIALIFFMGKWMYKLAEEFGKNKWLFAVLGVVSFYATQFVLGIILALAMGDSFFEISEMALNLIGIGVGFAGVWIFRSILKSSWKKEALRSPSTELLDDASNF